MATAACYGAADVTTGEPVTPGTRFSAGSLAKSMVATVISGLAEGFRHVAGDEVAQIARRSYAGEEVPEQE